MVDQRTNPVQVGENLTAENYSQVVSNALVKAVGGQVNNKDFVKALGAK